jgi:hypothetical protein
MATLVVLALITVAIGALAGIFLKVSFAIRREDHSRSLRFDAPNASARTARSVIGINSSRWD